MGLSIEQRGTVFLVAVVCLLVGGICAPFSGHDLQRAMQIAIASCAVLYGLTVTPLPRLVDRPTAFGLALIAVCSTETRPTWACSSEVDIRSTALTAARPLRSC